MSRINRSSSKQSPNFSTVEGTSWLHNHSFVAQSMLGFSFFLLLLRQELEKSVFRHSEVFVSDCASALDNLRRSFSVFKRLHFAVQTGASDRGWVC